MLSKAQNKYIRSLTHQKFRLAHKVFVAEGVKLAAEWLQAAGHVQLIAATEAWIKENTALILRHPEAQLHTVTEAALAAISALHTPNQVLLVIPLPAPAPLIAAGWQIALDDLQDPGNMGTIIRIADWFGIGAIICSPGCVDVWNPKVVQAGMGGHLRVALHTAPLDEYLQASALTKYAAVLGGARIYDVPRQKNGILIIGNESKGIRPEIQSLADKLVSIPKYGGAESLNAGVAAGILCALLLPC